MHFLEIFYDKPLLISCLNIFEKFKGLDNLKTCQWERPSATFRVQLSEFLLGKKNAVALS